MPRYKLIPLIAIVLASPVGPAEDAQETKPFTWDLSGEARFRPEWRGDADLNSDQDDDTRFGFMRLRLGLEIGIGGRYKVFVQAQDSRVAGEEESTGSNEQNLDLHQGFVEMKADAGGRWIVKLGRQELQYGDERLVGSFGWDNVGRSFDGAKVRYAREGFFLDGFYAQVANRIIEGATSGSDLIGVYAQVSPRRETELEGYALSFLDNLEDVGETGTSDDSEVHAFGGRARDRRGRFDYVVEAVVETGDIHGDELSAHAAAAQAGYTWGDDTKVRGFAGYDLATGDDDPADGDQGEFFNFFPTNHIHYGYADYEGWRNIKSPYGGVSIDHGRQYGQVKVHRFMLHEEAGPWKSAGGAILGFDPTGMSGSDVGTEIDLTYRIKWKHNAALQGGLSRFEPGRFARLTRGEDPSYWGYVMFTLGF